MVKNKDRDRNKKKKKTRTTKSHLRQRELAKASAILSIGAGAFMVQSVHPETTSENSTNTALSDGKNVKDTSFLDLLDNRTNDEKTSSSPFEQKKVTALPTWQNVQAMDKYTGTQVRVSGVKHTTDISEIRGLTSADVYYKTNILSESDPEVMKMDGYRDLVKSNQNVAVKSVDDYQVVSPHLYTSEKEALQDSANWKNSRVIANTRQKQVVFDTKQTSRDVNLQADSGRLISGLTYDKNFSLKTSKTATDKLTSEVKSDFEDSLEKNFTITYQGVQYHAVYHEGTLKTDNGKSSVDGYFTFSSSTHGLPLQIKGEYLIVTAKFGATVGSLEKSLNIYGVSSLEKNNLWDTNFDNPIGISLEESSNLKNENDVYYQIEAKKQVIQSLSYDYITITPKDTSTSGDTVFADEITPADVTQANQIPDNDPLPSQTDLSDTFASLIPFFNPTDTPINYSGILTTTDFSVIQNLVDQHYNQRNQLLFWHNATVQSPSVEADPNNVAPFGNINVTMPDSSTAVFGGTTAVNLNVDPKSTITAQTISDTYSALSKSLVANWGSTDGNKQPDASATFHNTPFVSNGQSYAGYFTFATNGNPLRGQGQLNGSYTNSYYDLIVAIPANNDLIGQPIANISNLKFNYYGVNLSQGPNNWILNKNSSQTVTLKVTSKSLNTTYQPGYEYEYATASGYATTKNVAVNFENVAGANVTDGGSLGTQPVSVPIISTNSGEPPTFGTGTAKVPDGYYLVDDSGNIISQPGSTFTVDGTSATVTKKVVPVSDTVTVHVKDQNGDPFTLPDGKTDITVNVPYTGPDSTAPIPADKIPAGYVVAKDNGDGIWTQADVVTDPSVLYSNDVQDVTIIPSQSTTKVIFVDEAGNTVGDASGVKVAIGETGTVDVKNIPKGYQLPADSDLTVDYLESEKTVQLTTLISVDVSYQTPDGDPVTGGGATDVPKGGTTNITPPPGYVVVDGQDEDGNWKIVDNPTIDSTNDNPKITVVPSTTTTTVTFTDQTSGKLLDDDTTPVTLDVNGTKTVSAPESYYLVDQDGKIVLDENGQPATSVDISYSDKDTTQDFAVVEQTKKVTVNLTSPDGTDHGDITVDVPYTGPDSTAPIPADKIPAGYVPVTASGKDSGGIYKIITKPQVNYGDPDSTLMVVPEETETIVKFVDENGKVVYSEKIELRINGVKKISIDDLPAYYTVLDDQDLVTRYMDQEKDILVKTLSTVSTDDGAVSENIPLSDSAATPSEISTDETSASEENLPRTGEKTSQAASAAGIFAVITSLFGFLFKRRKKDDEENK